MNGEGNLTSKYVRGNKLISKNGNEYFGYDGHGSVVNISNESGKSIKSYDYDAFGVELNQRTNVATEAGKYATSVPNVYTAGDMHRGQSLVVWAIREGREVAREVDESLMGYSNLVVQ